MRPQQLIVLMVAAGCGLGALYLFKMMTPPAGPAQTDTIPVVVAAQQLNQGTVISNPETMIKVVPYPRAVVPAGIISDPIEVAGRAIKYPIQPEQVITDANLAPKGATAGMAAMIEEGRQAVAVPITTDSAIAGFILPGSLVDIHLSTVGADNQRISKRILQGVKVLAVDNYLQKEESKDANSTRGTRVEMVTFDVSPQEAEDLLLAKSAGRLSLSLRSSIDKQQVESPVRKLEDLIASGTPEISDTSSAPDPILLDKIAKLEEENRRLKNAKSTDVAQKDQPPRKLDPAELRKLAEQKAVQAIEVKYGKGTKWLPYLKDGKEVIMWVAVKADNSSANTLKDELRSEIPEEILKPAVERELLLLSAVEDAPVPEPPAPKASLDPVEKTDEPADEAEAETPEQKAKT